MPLHIGEFVGEPRAFPIGAFGRALQFFYFGLEGLGGNTSALIHLDDGEAQFGLSLVCDIDFGAQAIYLFGFRSVCL